MPRGPHAAGRSATVPSTGPARFLPTPAPASPASPVAPGGGTSVAHAPPEAPVSRPAPAVPGSPAAAALSLEARDGRGDGTSAHAAETIRGAAVAGERSAGELLAALDADAAGRAGRVAGPPGGEGRVVLVARESAWIQIRSQSRDYVRTRTLEPGERYVLPNRTDLALWTGNAGGLEVLIDGQSVGTLGETGKVLRDLAISPDALKARGGAR